MKFIPALYITFSTALMISLSCCSEKKSADLELSPDKGKSKKTLSQHNHEDLEHFGMGEMKFEGLDFKQAASKLMTKYQAICADSDEQALAISIKITGTPDAKPTLLLRGNFNYILSQLCTLYGMEMKAENNSEYHFSAIPSQGEVSTLALRFPPGVEEICSVPDLQKLFNSTITQSQARATMTIKGQESDIARFQEYAKNLIDLKPLQIMTRTKIIRFSADRISEELTKSLENGEHLTDGQLQVMMREIATTKNADIISAPSIVSRFGESGTMEIIRVLKLDGKKLDNWIGLKHGITADYLGFKVNTDLDFEYGHIEGMDSLLSVDNKDLKFDENTKTLHHKTTHHVKIKSGLTTILNVDSPANSKGTSDYIVITQTIVDATGQKIESARSQ